MTTGAASVGGAPGGPDDRLLPWGKVKDITGLSRTTAWRRRKAGDFPLAVQITPGRVGWWESELASWKASRVPRSRSAPPATLRPEIRSSEVASTPARADGAPESLFVAKPLVRNRKSTRVQALSEGQTAFEF